MPPHEVYLEENTTSTVMSTLRVHAGRQGHQHPYLRKPAPSSYPVHVLPGVQRDRLQQEQTLSSLRSFLGSRTSCYKSLDAPVLTLNVTV